MQLAAVELETNTRCQLTHIDICVLTSITVNKYSISSLAHI